MKNGTYDAALSGVPETMLITLYNRASEAMRPDGILHDPDAVRIYESLDFDFENIFGPPRGGMASRALYFDRIIKEWLENHPEGFVVSLGEGLETQVFRVDNGKMRWLSIDLPEAIKVREQFLKPTDRFKHYATTAFNPIWMDQVNASDVLIVAQGLFMYFDEARVRHLVLEIFKRFPNAHVLFDFVSKSFVKRTQKGLPLTVYYTLPAMHWGISHNKIKNWLPEAKILSLTHYDIIPRGLPHIVVDRLLRKIPFIGSQLPGIAYIAKK